MLEFKYNHKELDDLTESFYELTGMLITLYDTQYHIISAYPKQDCPFCSHIKQSSLGAAHCAGDDKASFEASKKAGKCIIYTCHAGLIEATAPIIYEDFIIGYLMLGQTSNASSKEELYHILKHALLQYDLPVHSLNTYQKEISIHADRQILAASKIMEACISCILYKDMISVKRQNFKKNINEYLLQHLSEDLMIEKICLDLQISRRKLYEYSQKYLCCSIAKHLKNLRIEQAKKLLKKTELSVTIISEQCGFSDYNYFCRIFKKETGSSARDYRKNHLQTNRE